jgi:histidine triad (HIT) family protein
MAAMNADGIQIVQANEDAAAQTMFHLHIHIIPVYARVPQRRHAGETADHARLAENARKIAAKI